MTPYEGNENGEASEKGFYFRRDGPPGGLVVLRNLLPESGQRCPDVQLVGGIRNLRIVCGLSEIMRFFGPNILGGGECP